jgi:hypothetical protein
MAKFSENVRDISLDLGAHQIGILPHVNLTWKMPQAGGNLLRKIDLPEISCLCNLRYLAMISYLMHFHILVKNSRYIQSRTSAELSDMSRVLEIDDTCPFSQYIQAIGRELDGFHRGFINKDCKV